MKIRVLGCYGGSRPGLRPPCFLVEDRIAIDAGALTETLSLAEQNAISHILVSHSHIDHLSTLPFLLDNVLSTRRSPIRLRGPGETIKAIQRHLFNDVIWPDFTQISNGTTRILEMEPLECGQTLRIGEIEITPVPMEHTVVCHGHLLQAPDAAVVICSDTVSTAGLSPLLERAVNLKAVVLETSFPRRMARIAQLSQHLSTDSFVRASAIVPPGVELLVSHLKPEYADEIREEILGLGRQGLSLLEQDRVYRF